MALLKHGAEDDDEFFGSQESDEEIMEHQQSTTITNRFHDTEFGSLAEREFLAKENELKSIGFLDAYESHKEVKLQAGFEAGLVDTYGVAIQIGKIIGELSTLEQLRSIDRSARTQRQQPKLPVAAPTPSPTVRIVTSKTDMCSEAVNRFFHNTFQKDEAYGGCKDDLQQIEKTLRDIMLRKEEEIS
jgi:hypothetical protein